MAQPKPDVLAALDHILAAADTRPSPWRSRTDADDAESEYVPDYRLLHELLAVPIKQGAAQSQQSGRVAKSLDAYVAHELRRAGFPEEAVFPRPYQPRVVPHELREVELNIQAVLKELADFEAKSGGRLKPASLRAAIARLARSMPGAADANILGRFYAKQVDVVVSDWRRGPDVLVSGKSQFSSYLNNKNNRYEEAIGEARNLRDRYPLAAMGYAYIVRDNVFDGGAFELLRDLLVRLRKPDGPFDATMLLVAEWDDDTLELLRVSDPTPTLALPRFFENLLNAVMTYTPVDVHSEVRARKRSGPPLGGYPPEAAPGSAR
ncbi:MAG: hypothetical protein WD399_07260 [Thermoleophilaceae bacterium]